MRKRKLFRAAALTLAFTVCLGACAPKQDESSSSGKKDEAAKQQPASIGEIADYLVKASDDYNKIERGALLKDIEGSETDKADKIQALVMGNRAFGTLPAPVGNNARLAPGDVDLTAVPDWAKSELENLKNAGVLADSDLAKDTDSINTEDTGSGDTEGADSAGPEDKSSAPDNQAPAGAVKDDTAAKGDAAAKSGSSESQSGDGYAVAGGEDDQKEETDEDSDSVSLADVETVVRRIWNLLGSNLKDDFYANINKKYMDNSELPAGENTAGGLYDQRILVTKQISDMIMKVVKGSGYSEGSREQKKKMQDLYLSAADMETRNKLGAEPLRPYLEMINSAKTIDEFNDALTRIQKELAIGETLNILQLTDTKDNKKWALHIQPAVMPSFSQEEYDDPDNKNIAAQLKLNKTLLMLTGESKEDAEEQAGATFELEKKLLPDMPSSKEFNDPSKIYKKVSFKEAKKMFPNLDLEALIKAYGFEKPEKLTLNAPKLLEAYSRLLNQENLELLKADAKLTLLSSFARELSQDFLDAYNEYNTIVTGAEEDTRTPEALAVDTVSSTLGDYTDQLYVEQYFSPEAKADVEKMIQSFIENYKKRIKELDWMSDETKKKAIKKLNNMRFFVGYPDEWTGHLERLDIDPNDFFGNQTQARKLTRDLTAAQQFEENEPQMALPASMVNAYYNQFNNTMAFPAGILQAPFYDVNAAEEENLAGIGTIIAHEMTHAFDNKGAKYDENGNPNDWWSKADYKKFEELCSKVSDFYDGWESATGIEISGQQTLGENIADIGSMACMLDILRQKKDADYDTFFRAYAKSWLKAGTRENTEFMAGYDEHSPGNLRTNRVVSNFKEFFDTFDIKPGDGMYVAKENRIKIW